MIDLYAWNTSNGRKISIALEEMNLPYTLYPVNIYKDEQFAPEFLKLSPNNRIPAIRDTETGQILFESGAILMYLAKKTGLFMPADGPDYWLTLQWLMWQMGGIGPMLGQAAHFLQYKPDASAYSAERYGTEARRLYGVLDRRLEQARYVAGKYSIADMAIWPWISRFEHQKIHVGDFPNVARWYREVVARPAVVRGYDILNQGEYPPQIGPVTQFNRGSSGC